MTDDRNINENEQSQDRVVPVVRDQPFIKLFADSVFVQDLGRDVDLCLIQYGQPLSHIQTIETGISAQTSNCVTEAGRVRLAWPVATSVAMSILMRGIESGVINGSRAAKILQEKADANEAEGVSDDD